MGMAAVNGPAIGLGASIALLCDTIGHPEWKSDTRFATREDWAANIESVIRPAIEEWARDKTRLEACSALCGQGVAAGPSNLAEDIHRDPHVQSHDMLIEVPRPDSDKPMQIAGNPVKLSNVAEGPIRSFPGLGQHTDDVLTHDLALDAQQLTQLRDDGVIA